MQLSAQGALSCRSLGNNTNSSLFKIPMWEKLTDVTCLPVIHSSQAMLWSHWKTAGNQLWGLKNYCPLPSPQRFRFIWLRVLASTEGFVNAPEWIQCAAKVEYHCYRFSFLFSFFLFFHLPTKNNFSLFFGFQILHQSSSLTCLEKCGENQLFLASRFLSLCSLTRFIPLSTISGPGMSKKCKQPTRGEQDAKSMTRTRSLFLRTLWCEHARSGTSAGIFPHEKSSQMNSLLRRRYRHRETEPVKTSFWSSASPHCFRDSS